MKRTVSVKKHYPGAIEELDIVINNGHFDMGAFVKVYEKAFPGAFDSAVGREFVMHALNASAKAAVRRTGNCIEEDVFDSEIMLDSLVSLLPRITEKGACACLKEPGYLTEPLVADSFNFYSELSDDDLIWQ